MADSSKERKALRSLAQLYGVQAAFTDVLGKRRTASDDSLIGALRALGAPVSGPADAAAALEEKKRSRVARGIEPVMVAWNGKMSGQQFVLPRDEREKSIGVRLELESGEKRAWGIDLSECRPIRYETIGKSVYVTREIPVPETLPPGYHTLYVESASGLFTSRIISAPEKAFLNGDNGRMWGVFMPLYALHSQRSPGGADLGDVAALYGWLDGLGGDIVGTLPFLAAFLDTPFEPSPYSPASRLFWNEFYIDLEKAPELRKSDRARSLLDSYRKEAEELRFAPLVDYRRQMAAKRKVLEELSKIFFSRPAVERADFDRYCRENPALDDYASFRAFGERLGTGWERWPTPQNNGEIGPADYDESVRDYHLYVQWEMERQIGELSDISKKSGPGLYLDLPLGINPGSYDTWRYRELFPKSATGGAPPDVVFPAGQNWGFPPLHPEKIREDGYRYVVAGLRKVMSRAGVLRLDHVPGLHRIYWIPEGMDASQGVFVRYSADELYAVLSLESHRNRCVLVGENLGTVPEYVNQAMARHNVLKMYVVQYELEGDDPRVLRPPPANSVLSLNTHDMPPFAGFLRGSDIADRVDAGILDSQKAPEEMVKRKGVRESLEKFLAAKGFLRGSASEESLMAACLEYLAAGPGRFLLINLEDLWLEDMPQNLPGTAGERPNWKRKARLGIEEFRNLPEVINLLRKIDELRKQPRKKR